MFPIQPKYAAGPWLLSLLVLTSATGAVCFGQKPQALGDGKPRPFKALYDRRVNFPVDALTVSKDRKWLAAMRPTYQFGVQPQYTIVVVDATTGQAVRELPCHTNLVNKLVFSPDGKRLYGGLHPTFSGNYFSFQGSSALIVWEVATGKRLKEMTTSLWDLAPDGKHLAVVDNWIDIDPGAELPARARIPSSFTMQVLDTSTWKQVGQLQDKNDVNMTALRFSPDGKTLALAVAPYSVRLWDWQAGKETLRIEATKLDEGTVKLWGQGQVPILEFSPDGALLASITDLMPDYYEKTRTIDLWQVSTGKRVRSLEAAQYRPHLLAFTPKGNQLALATGPVDFRLLDAATGKVLQHFSRNSRRDLAVELHRHGLTPEQAPQAPELFQRLWNLASGDDIQAGNALENPQCLAFAPDDRTLAVGDHNGLIRLVDVITGKELQRFSDNKNGKGAVTALTFLEAGKRLCAQYWNGQLHSWDPQTGKLLESMPNFWGQTSPLAVSADGKLAFGLLRAGGGVVIRDGLKDKKRPQIVRFKGGSRIVQFTPDGKKLLAGAWEGQVQVIDVASAKVESTIGAAEVADFGLSPDGATVATWSRTPKFDWDKSVKLWDLSGAARGEIPVQPSAHNGLRFTPDGKGLFVAQNGGFGLWEVSARQRRTVIQGTYPIAVSNNGRLVVCKGDGCLFVWDLTGRNNGGTLDAGRLTDQELTQLWASLQADAGKAYPAIWRLAGASAQSVPFLEKKVADQPAPGHVVALRIVEVLEQNATPDARRLLKLLAGPDRPQFAAAAQAALGRLKE